MVRRHSGDLFKLVWKYLEKGWVWNVDIYKISIGPIAWASLVAQMVKNPPAMLETWVPSLGWEDPLEEDMATHSSILARRIPWTEPDRLQSLGSQRVGHD